MPLDGLTLKVIKDELTEKILTGRIDKIYQPDEKGLVLRVRSKGTYFNLIFSIDPNNFRVHLTAQPPGNLPSPSGFCMLLRKYLSGGRIERITQLDLDRVIFFHIARLNEIGEMIINILVAEMTGRYSNIILLRGSDKTILGSMKSITTAINRYREILPGRAYIPPPPQNKLNPLILTAEEIDEFILSLPLKMKLKDALVSNLAGVGPVLAEEITYRAGLESSIKIEEIVRDKYFNLKRTMGDIFSSLEKGYYFPVVVEESDSSKPKAYSIIDLKQLEGSSFESKHFEKLNEAMDYYYSRSIQYENIERMRRKLTQVVKKELTRCYKKLKFQKKEIARARKADELRLKGELLLANLPQLSSSLLIKGEDGETTVSVINYYDPEQRELSIPINPSLGFSQNAQKYFAKYNKAKKSLKAASLQAELTSKEIEYLEQLQTDVDIAESELLFSQIEEELLRAGYLKPSKKVSKISKKKDFWIRLEEYISSDGWNILVGKNSRQNDLLTMKIAKSDDLWLHTREIPGSHVIIRAKGKGEIPPDRTLEEAGLLAAYFSKARESSNVPVDYTFIRYVKKPKGAKPGMVIYSNQKTLFITPDPKKIQNLKRVDN